MVARLVVHPFLMAELLDLAGNKPIRIEQKGIWTCFCFPGGAELWVTCKRWAHPLQAPPVPGTQLYNFLCMAHKDLDMRHHEWS